jgi:osmotically-inducible protein OsmY
MEHNDPRRRQASQDLSQRDRSPHGHDRGDEREFSRERHAESGTFSPDWSRDNAEPVYSDDAHYSRNRAYESQRTGESQRGGGPGGWRGDENRRTTEEQRQRGFTPREDHEHGGHYGRGELGRNYPYESSDRGRENERARDRAGDEGSHYRGYYRRSTVPFDYPGGSGTVYAESWTLVGPFTGRGPKGYRRSDQQIIDDASQRLEHDGHIDATEIEVSAQDGVITLRGTVPDRATKRRAEDCVESVYGARDVMNELRVAAATAAEPSQSSQASPRAQRSRSSTPSSTATGRTGAAAGGTSAESTDDQKH